MIPINIEQMSLPDGWFNGAAVQRPDGNYIMVIRDQADTLHGGVLGRDFKPISTFHSLGLSYNIDPRLTWWNGRPYMTSRYYGDWNYWRMEFWPLTMDGCIDHHDEQWKHTRFMMIEDWPGYTRRRENNWAPFVANDDELHYVHSYDPHRVLWYDRKSRCVRKVTEEPTRTPRWSVPNLCEMRLNTNPVRLRDGSLLSTMHAKNYATNSYYTGFYRFEGQKPYKIMQASAEPFLKPQHTVGPMYRAYAARATFPLSLHLDGQNVTLIGGSRDAAQIVVHAKLSDVLSSLKDA